ncbi:hypothetical protein PTKU64_63170 [Paraburkholderia terrae]|uniref:Uncharacterized protein n=1 Tax=Paraburkholderia terrae TaxID=311230 RepID=A0ABN6JP03_9BURK|nr:hypothetical protein PTKU64_63170 [Paraburkholderia terrae]
MHDLRDGTAGAHCCNHAVLATRNALAKVQNFVDAGSGHKDGAATVGNHVVIFLHGHTRNLDGSSGVDLNHAVREDLPA